MAAATTQVFARIGTRGSRKSARMWRLTPVR